MNHTDVLLYLTDGILPLLQSFYAEFYDPGQKRRQLDITGKVLRALLVRLYTVAMVTIPFYRICVIH